jgi:hypothetical protein
MALSDELTKLQDLHQRGALTDEEFSRAKDRLLDESAAPTATSTPSPAGRPGRYRPDDRLLAFLKGL